MNIRLITLSIILFFALAGWGVNAAQQYPKDALLIQHPVSGAVGWHIHALNDDVDTAAELIARNMGTAYAQLASVDYLEVVSASAADTTQTVTVYGINSDGNKARDDIELNGTTAVESGVTFVQVENARLDIEAAGVITVRRKTGDTFIMDIPIGSLNSQIAQHFNGEEISYITSFAAGMHAKNGGILFELRWYNDASDSLDPTDGFEVLDRMSVFVNDASNYINPVPHYYHNMPIRVPKGGWLVVYGTGLTNNSDGWATIRGFDVKID